MCVCVCSVGVVLCIIMYVEVCGSTLCMRTCTKPVEDGAGAGACVCVLTWVCELCVCACVHAWGKQMQLRKRENTDKMMIGAYRTHYLLLVKQLC